MFLEKWRVDLINIESETMNESEGEHRRFLVYHRSLQPQTLTWEDKSSPFPLFQLQESCFRLFYSNQEYRPGLQWSVCVEQPQHQYQNHSIASSDPVTAYQHFQHQPKQLQGEIVTAYSTDHEDDERSVSWKVLQSTTDVLQLNDGDRLKLVYDLNIITLLLHPLEYEMEQIPSKLELPSELSFSSNITIGIIKETILRAINRWENFTSNLSLFFIHPSDMLSLPYFHSNELDNDSILSEYVDPLGFCELHYRLMFTLHVSHPPLETVKMSLSPLDFLNLERQNFQTFLQMIFTLFYPSESCFRGGEQWKLFQWVICGDGDSAASTANEKQLPLECQQIVAADIDEDDDNEKDASFTGGHWTQMDHLDQLERGSRLLLFRDTSVITVFFRITEEMSHWPRAAWLSTSLSLPAASTIGALREKMRSHQWIECGMDCQHDVTFFADPSISACSLHSPTLSSHLPPSSPSLHHLGDNIQLSELADSFGYLSLVYSISPVPIMTSLEDPFLLPDMKHTNKYLDGNMVENIFSHCYFYSSGVQAWHCPKEDRILVIPNLLNYVRDNISFYSTQLYGALPFDSHKFQEALLLQEPFDSPIALFAIFDGHVGKFAAEYAQATFPFAVCASKSFLNGDYATSLKDATHLIHVSLNSSPGYLPESNKNFCSGTTVSVALVTASKTYIAMLGDSPVWVHYKSGTRLKVNSENMSSAIREHIISSNMFGLQDANEKLLSELGSYTVKSVVQDLDRRNVVDRFGFAGLNCWASIGDYLYECDVFNLLLSELFTANSNCIYPVNASCDLRYQILRETFIKSPEYDHLSKYIIFRPFFKQCSRNLQSFLNTVIWKNDPSVNHYLSHNAFIREPWTYTVENHLLGSIFLCSDGVQLRFPVTTSTTANATVGFKIGIRQETGISASDIMNGNYSQFLNQRVHDDRSIIAIYFS